MKDIPPADRFICKNAHKRNDAQLQKDIRERFSVTWSVDDVAGIRDARGLLVCNSFLHPSTVPLVDT